MSASANTMEDLQQLFKSFTDIKVAVVGDVMLDVYMWGKVDRISPEAPVPVVALQHTEKKMGGAANVALNIQSLGAKPFIVSVTGDDQTAVDLHACYDAHKLNYKYSIKSRKRKTTSKIRVIGRNQQMMRLDDEEVHDLNFDDQEKLLAGFRKLVEKEKPQVLILEDYNKGVLTEYLIAELISIAQKAGMVIAVDPKQKNFFQYQGVDIFKPNLKEVKDAFGLTNEEFGLYQLSDIHRRLQDELDHGTSLITLSSKGVFYQQDEPHLISSHIRKVADVTGAGDTVIAVAALVYAVKKNVHLMADIANTAGGLVCEQVGTVAISRDALLQEYALLHE